MDQDCYLAANKRKQELIEKLVGNDITPEQLRELCKTANEKDISIIVQWIYDLNEDRVHELAAVERMLQKLNDAKNLTRNGRFRNKIDAGFRDGKDCRVILAEGDSWFNYPVVLTDVIDWLGMEKNFAIYSIASGGDWFMNMLNEQQYIEELSLVYPDVFLVSGGGNDIVGARRVAAIVDPDKNGVAELHKNAWAKNLIENANPDFIPLRKKLYDRGLPFLSKEFFALLMLFHVQYYYLFKHILCKGSEDPGIKGKFYPMKVITQGYDYALPKGTAPKFSFRPRRWYVPLIRQLGHGIWLQTPLQMRGITNKEDQRAIVYCLIYFFNEMMIHTGKIFNEKKGLGDTVYHIDSRESVGEKGWSDELHPLPQKFRQTAATIAYCINQRKLPTYDHVYVVKTFFK